MILALVPQLGYDPAEGVSAMPPCPDRQGAGPGVVLSSGSEPSELEPEFEAPAPDVDAPDVEFDVDVVDTSG